MSYYNIESRDVRLSACWFVPHIAKTEVTKLLSNHTTLAVGDVFRTSFILLFHF